jgi:hypothetical protein
MAASYQGRKHALEVKVRDLRSRMRSLKSCSIVRLLDAFALMWHLVFNDAVGKTVRSYLITDQSASAAVVASESCISSQQCLTCILELRMEGDVYEVNEPQ